LFAALQLIIQLNFKEFPSGFTLLPLSETDSKLVKKIEVFMPHRIFQNEKITGLLHKEA
jgi:hypothetical protein